MRFHRALPAALMLIAFGSGNSLQAEPVAITGKDLTVRVDLASSSFSIQRASSTWTFTGSVGQHISNLAKRSGHDRLGAFSAITFEWTADGLKRAEIRAYVDQPIVQFVLTCESAQSKAPAAFPVLQPPRGLHLFSYNDTNFASPRFAGRPGGTPWLMFDDQAHAVIMSPASHFMIADVHAVDDVKSSLPITTDEQVSDSNAQADRVPQTTDGQIASDLIPKLRDLPEGFSHATILVFGDGINSTWNTWGEALTDLSGKTRPANDADISLKSFGYWTDNGTCYYYNYDTQIGYAATLQAVVSKFRKLSIPLGYLQLDSWWYSKSFTGPDGKAGDPYKKKELPRGAWNAYGGLMEYAAHKDLFPNGLKAFHDAIGLPFITHNRWMDPKSPYHAKYRITGVAAIDPKWWDDIADYLRSSGVVTYEQDWLDRIYRYSPEFQTSSTAADAFMDNMSRATGERGITMQYCMGQPRHFLQGSKYDNLTTVRVSDDRFGRDRWQPSLYVSQMAAALGEWPWVDTFDSRETPNMILANLSAGMVGVGDKIDDIDPGNIRKVIRADGVIVKPDTAITPLDQTYVNDANGKDAPMIAAAFAGNGSLRTAYVFAYPRNAKQMQLHLRPSDLGIAGDAWIYDAIDGVGKKVAAGASFDATFKDTSAQTAWAYYIVAPTSHSGIALLGDKERFVSLGRQRIDQVTETPDGIAARVLIAKGEHRIILHGFAPAAPRITAIEGGRVDDISFNLETHAFSVAVFPAIDGGSVSVAIAAK